MFWMRLGTCSSITSFSFPFLFFSFPFCFCFSSYGLPVLALYITYIELFFSRYGFYINHAIVTPLHPFGLLVSKKTIYIDVVDTRITLTRSLLFVSSFLFLLYLSSSLLLFSSITSLLFSSPPALLLTWITGFLLRYARLVFLPYISSLFSLFLFSFLFFADTNRL